MRGFGISPEPIKARLQQMTTDWTGKMGPLWKAHNQKDNWAQIPGLAIQHSLWQEEPLF